MQKFTEEQYIRCKICKQLFIQITSKHLAKHNILPKEYKKKFEVQNLNSLRLIEKRRELVKTYKLTFKGHTHTKEAIKNIQRNRDHEKFVENCRKIWTPEKIAKQKITHFGKKNGRFSHGRYSGMTLEFRKLGRMGKEEKCENCGTVFSNCKKNKLAVHHRDRNPRNNSLENLLLLCQSCHLKEHNKEIHAWRKK